MLHPISYSLKNATSGIWIALKEQRNLKVHFLVGLLVIFLGYYFEISPAEWVILTFTIGLVIFAELVNTAIEEIVNSFTENTHPAAKKAKDVAAGAVLAIAIMALIIGLTVFFPYFQNFLSY